MSYFIISIAVLILLVLLNVPIAFALGGSALTLFVITDVSLSIIPLKAFGSTTSFTLLAIPLFMFLGAIMERTKISDALINFSSSLVGWLKGGLAMVNVVVSMFFAGMSGSSASDVSSIGSILIPQMQRKGYPKDFSVAITSFSSTAALIIPPSISMILYGIIAQVSIIKLFIAGIIPGLILGAGQLIMCYIFAKKYNYPIEEKFEMGKLLKNFFSALPAFIIPVTILGGVLGGIFTITESAAAAVVVAILLSVTIFRKNLNMAKIREALIVTSTRTAVIMLLIAMAGLLGWFIANEQIPQKITQQILLFTDNPLLILLFINIFLAIMGCFLSSGAALVILAPILVPMAESLGINLLHFGIIMILNLDMGTQTPPVGGTMLLACVIGKATIGEVFRVNKYFILFGFAVVLLVTYFPIISLWLPSIFTK